MIWIAITIQLILSAGLLWATWQIWMFRHTLKATIKTVDSWTKYCENGLQVSTPSLEVARGGVDMTRRKYQTLQMQLEKVRQLFSVLSRGVSFLGSRWQKSSKSASASVTNQSSNKSSDSRSTGSQHNVKRRR
jgi:hypothetical protein